MASGIVEWFLQPKMGCCSVPLRRSFSSKRSSSLCFVNQQRAWQTKTATKGSSKKAGQKF